MKYLIIDNEVVGRVADGADALGNATLKTGPWAPENSDLYVEGGEVLLKPARPSAEAWWDKDTNAWKEPAALPTVDAPDWDGFAAELRGGAIWAKFWAAGKANLECNLAATLLLGTITGTRNIADLNFALSELIAAMDAASGITGLTANQKQALSDLRGKHGLNV